MAQILNTGNYSYSQVVDRLVSKGDIHMVNGTVTGIKDPVNETDAANFNYVNIIADSQWKESVKAGTTVSITLSGEQTVDGIVLVSGDRILVKNQADGIENGIYDINSGAWSRSSDLDVGDSASGATIWIESGTINSDSSYVCTNDSGNDIVGTDSLTFQIFSRSGGLYSAGTGIDVTSNVVSIDSTVIRTTGGQTITGNLDINNTVTGGTISDGTSNFTGGDISTDNLTVTDQIFLTDTNQVSTSTNTIDGTQGNLNTQGSISLYNPTKNRIIFRPNAGDTAPTDVTRSDGTKIVLKPTIGTTDKDVAIGVDGTSTIWHTVPDGGFFRWYAGETEIMTIDADNKLTTVDTINISTTVGNWTSSSLFTDGFTDISFTIYMDKDSVTQSGTINSPVTLNKPSGTITTVSASNATQVSENFQVNNSFVTSTTIIKAQISSYSGSQGSPIIAIRNIAAGSFQIEIINAGTLDLDGTLTISYVILGN